MRILDLCRLRGNRAVAKAIGVSERLLTNIRCGARPLEISGLVGIVKAFGPMNVRALWLDSLSMGENHGRVEGDPPSGAALKKLKEHLTPEQYQKVFEAMTPEEPSQEELRFVARVLNKDLIADIVALEVLNGSNDG
jgi:hypothetical protein